VQDQAPPAGAELSLVEKARSGDRTAFGHLYERYAKMVHGVLLSRAPHGEVRDLAQEVFAVALERISSLRQAEAFGPWLATIARNRARDYHKQARPTQAYDETASSDRPDQKAEALKIMQHLRELPDTYRETLVLRLVEGMTGPEIAEQTGMTHGSVRVNLHRGMTMLRERLEGGR
jgi:RNA polymerase sigma-70 factor (ECF subfamily)